MPPWIFCIADRIRLIVVVALRSCSFIEKLASIVEQDSFRLRNDQKHLSPNSNDFPNRTVTRPER